MEEKIFIHLLICFRTETISWLIEELINKN